MSTALCAYAQEPPKDPESAGEVEGAGETGDSGPVDAAKTALEEAVEQQKQLVEDLNVKAQRVRQLADGLLDPLVDERELFSIDLSDGSITGDKGERLLALLRDLREVRSKPTRRFRKKKKRVPATTVEAATDDLLDAYKSFLALSPELRQERIDEHRERRTRAQENAKTDKVRLTTLQDRISKLEAFLNGKLDIAVSLDEVIKVDLSARNEVATSTSRLDRVVAEATNDGTAASAADRKLPVDLASAEAALDRLRLQFLRSTPEERRALRETHLSRQRSEAMAKALASDEVIADPTMSEATATEIERQKALRAAQDAASQELRRLATERARLLGVKEAQARFAMRFAERKDEHLGYSKHVASLAKQVSDLQNRSVMLGDKTGDAERLYPVVSSAVKDGRDSLRRSLKSMRAKIVVPNPGEKDPVKDIDHDREELDALRREVTAVGHKLTADEQKLVTGRADAIAADLKSINQARLKLLQLVSSSFYNNATGLGARGVREVRGESSQIDLVVRHSAAKMPQRFDKFVADLGTSPLPLIFDFLKFFFVLIAFRIWRQRADGMLEGFIVDEEGEPRSGTMATTAWYLRRIRGPLEWLGLIWALLRFSRLSELPGAEYVWICAAWLLTGKTIILLLDAIAARENLKRRRPSKTAQLRLRSLRLVGWTIAVLGMLLGLTSEVVGTGAIYAWVIRVCWLLALPIAWVIVRWWKPTVFEMLKYHREDNPVLRYVRSHRTDWQSGIAAAVGGAYLLAQGALRWCLRSLSKLDGAQRIRALLFRRQVARASEEDAHRAPVEQLVYDRFQPDERSESPMDSIGGAVLIGALDMLRDQNASISVLVGERGSGKSTMLERIDRAVGGTHLIKSPFSYDDLLVQLNKSGALAKDSQKPILIDDLHRIVRPVIGGYDGFDQLDVLTRESKKHWILAIDTAAWQCIRLARDTTVVDRVFDIGRWSEAEIGDLLRQRTAAADVAPDFEALVIPRQLDAPPEYDDESQKEEGYYKVLWDASNGNPAVALHYWRESLYKGDESVGVRLYREPPIAEVEMLSPTVSFVLRDILQMDLASPEDLVISTALPDDAVRDAIHLGLERGYLEEIDGRVRVTWPWFRAITGLMSRKNLLVLS